MSDALSGLLQRWRRPDGNVHRPGQAPAAHTGARVCGHLRAGVGNEVLPDVHGTDRGRSVINMHL